MDTISAEASNEHVRVALRPALPLTLHGEETWRTDGNSPVLVDKNGTTVFFSDYLPRGHTLRRRGAGKRVFSAPSIPVRLIDDPDPQVGKWIEAVALEQNGGLRGWYHAEELAACPQRLFVPHIGEVISDDGGCTWRCRGEVLRAPPDQIDCSWRNGFFAGGYGDLCVVPDRIDGFLYLFFTSYLADEDAQGVSMGRLPARRQLSPSDGLELWSADGWQPAGPTVLPQPIWRPVRGWRYADPNGFWGPAVHYNRGLDAYVMLLNRTAGGAGDLVQEGIYVSVNAAPKDAQGWSTPLQIVRGGAWYPQVVGLEPGEGDALAGQGARFFMGGFSAWEIEFAAGDSKATSHPLRPDKSSFAEAFGRDKRCPW